MPVETTQFAGVMRELGSQQIFALSPQAKGRVERMLETFQDRLVTELRLAGASTIDQAKEVLQEFLPRFNARFAVAAEHPEMAYRPVPAELSLTELDFTQNPGKVMDDITFVRSHWWLVSEGFSLSTANSDVQKLPATLYHRIADSLAYAA